MRNVNVKTRAEFSAVNFLIQTLAGELVSVVPPDEFIYEEWADAERAKIGEGS